MDISKLITPKKKVLYLYNDMTVGEIIEKYSKNRYSTVPVLERESGRYLYSISAGDLIGKIVKVGDFEEAKKAPISTCTILRFIIPCNVHSDLESLQDLILSQNFVPVIDDQGIFLGILTRQSALKELFAYMKRNKKNA